MSNQQISPLQKHDNHSLSEVFFSGARILTLLIAPTIGCNEQTLKSTELPPPPKWSEKHETTWQDLTHEEKKLEWQKHEIRAEDPFGDTLSEETVIQLLNEKLEAEKLRVFAEEAKELEQQKAERVATQINDYNFYKFALSLLELAPGDLSCSYDEETSQIVIKKLNPSLEINQLLVECDNYGRLFLATSQTEPFRLSSEAEYCDTVYITRSPEEMAKVVNHKFKGEEVEENNHIEIISGGDFNTEYGILDFSWDKLKAALNIDSQYLQYTFQTVTHEVVQINFIEPKGEIKSVMVQSRILNETANEPFKYAYLICSTESGYSEEFNLLNSKYFFCSNAIEAAKILQALNNGEKTFELPINQAAKELNKKNTAPEIVDSDDLGKY